MAFLEFRGCYDVKTQSLPMIMSFPVLLSRLPGPHCMEQETSGIIFTGAHSQRM